MTSLPELEATVFRRVADGRDPWDGDRGRVGSRWCSQALGRLERKGLVRYEIYDESPASSGSSGYELTDIGKALASLPKCQAEDMGGHPACDSPSTLRTKEEPRHFYCDRHRKNRHVWRPKEELEAIPEAPC